MSAVLTRVQPQRKAPGYVVRSDQPNEATALFRAGGVICWVWPTDERKHVARRAGYPAWVMVVGWCRGALPFSAALSTKKVSIVPLPLTSIPPRGISM